jgi:hypothetical protein
MSKLYKAALMVFFIYANINNIKVSYIMLEHSWITIISEILIATGITYGFFKWVDK